MNRGDIDAIDPLTPFREESPAKVLKHQLWLRRHERFDNGLSSAPSSLCFCLVGSKAEREGPKKVHQSAGNSRDGGDPVDCVVAVFSTKPNTIHLAEEQSETR